MKGPLSHMTPLNKRFIFIYLYLHLKKPHEKHSKGLFGLILHIAMQRLQQQTWENIRQYFGSGHPWAVEEQSASDLGVSKLQKKE